MPQTIAVLTGDIVKSSKLSADELDSLFAALEAALKDIRQWPNAPKLLAFTRFRGDGWQVAFDKPELALRIALFLRAAIRAKAKKFQTRIAIGIGTADALHPNDLSKSTGSAFERSGHCLDGLKKSFLFGIDTGENSEKSRLLRSIFIMADALSADWTERQAEVMRFVLLPDSPSQTEIGKQLSTPIKQAATARRFETAHGPAIVSGVETFESQLSYNITL